MDSLKGLMGSATGDQAKAGHQQRQQGSSPSSSGGGFVDRLHGMVGGGPESEKKEDGLDKAIDYVQENFLGQGPQNNESALEQAKDGQIAGFVRSQYKGVTGKEFPGADKK
ncbi:unnamed protein product [Tuber aestivum]|uniref:DNA damage-responsive protein 48 n=1 Tax=Tuber aestivum TaxID=59557 RepID=A0A292PRZ3_9PEZI|nr:unnamed protein product [Tuber aestivum]